MPLLLRLAAFASSLACMGLFCVASEDFPQVPVEEVVYDYEPVMPETDVRRREAGLSKEEQEGLQSTGSANRGSVRGAARGAARGSVRGAARGAARGSVRGTARGSVRGSVRGVARGAARGSVRGAARGTVRGELFQESQIESIYAEFEDTLYLLPDRIEPLAPQGVGYTYETQPNLYFYMDKASSKPIEFTLNRKDALDPVIISYIHVDPETQVLDSGIHSVSLERLGITLEESVEYEWFVTIIVDVVERSGDIVASGIVTHQKEAEILINSENPGLLKYVVYSSNGYWYDAINAVMSLREDNEQPQVLHRQLIHWLSQEKLPSTCSFLSKS